MEETSISLIDLVFSWSIQDALNPNLYKSQVRKIPETFTSTADYFSSFTAPLVEETHADLLSAMARLSRAPSYQLSSIERDITYRAPTDFSYKIILRNSNQSDLVTYRPQGGDLAALTDVRPTCISDLNRPTMTFLLAYVQAVGNDKISLWLSMPVVIEQKMHSYKKKHIDLFFVFLTNVTTNIRIWKALHPDPLRRNLQMIYKVIHMNADVSKLRRRLRHVLDRKQLGYHSSFESYGLNDSQEAAIASCIKTWRCCHQNSVKLIWGPPGTGKTKTVAGSSRNEMPNNYMYSDSHHGDGIGVSAREINCRDI
ncbi:hypothetical protein F3Y22_tig00110596pilonHSYRG00003 [Hibiscus syriacus]|uniref:Uncharacterized protein n=1 Tax=Hibiscus syriacus TaxID=106335 RepID=A0A6A3A504_HIBSY|nr:hypothetical protein F3Y22_tig00110596pilonHSYRG00003 [Hibiscus syriacus]